MLGPFGLLAAVNVVCQVILVTAGLPGTDIPGGVGITSVQFVLALTVTLTTVVVVNAAAVISAARL